MDIDFHLLETITNRFSDEQKVGSGRYGDVYKGMYKGKEIAVKKLHPLEGIDDRAFDSEFRNLSKVEHKNVIQLLGHCYQKVKKYVPYKGELVLATEMERILCFEYIEGGSIEKHIEDEYCRLDWHTCYEIIKGTCDGLNHLHGAHKKPIFHLDLKLSNILLDKNRTAKIADLGLSRLVASTETHKTQMVNVKGTLGYMPPEYIDSGYISKKYDVFSLGVILLKIITGNKGHYNCYEMSTEQFTKSAIENWERRLQERSRYSSHKKEVLQVKKCIEIALKCVEKDQYKRPSIRDIVHELEELEAKIKDMSLYSDMSRNLIDQTSCTCNVLSLDKTLELCFPFELQKDISTSLQLTNNTDGFIAFRVEINHAKYSAKPTKGIMAPCSRCYIFVTLGPQDEAPPNMECNDMILVKSARVSEGFKFTSNEIIDDSLKGVVVDMIKLPIVYVMAGKVPLYSDLSEDLIGQTSSGSSVLSVDQSQELRFLFEPRKDVTSCLKLTNRTDGFIAFSIKINKHKYCTQPNTGVMPPGSNCYIRVTLRAQQEAPPDMKCHDMVNVQSACVSKDFKFTCNEITDDSLKEGKVVDMMLPIVYFAPDQFQEAINSMKSSEAPMMSYLTGSMNSLVDKLTEPKYILTFGKLHEDLVTLKKDYFNKLVGNGQGVVNLQVKVWIKQVRELVFDIEDWIDGKLETIMRDPTMIEEKIEEFKTLIKEARIRCKRYDLLIKAPTRGADVVGVVPSKIAAAKSPLILGDKTCGLVGLDRPKEMLKKYLLDERKKLKVVSIHGNGGLGKTTLAKELHGELQAKFTCSAFIYIGRDPSVRTILVHILYQTISSSDRKVYFKPTPKRGDDDFFPRKEHDHEVILEKHLDEQQVIALLWGHLIKRRYLIVLDGLWSIQYWRAISGALPDNNLGSRILTTTRIMDVAESCSSGRSDVVHHMETLSEVESIRLFSREAGRPADDEILKMCGGIPLAIVLAAGAMNCEELGGAKMPGKTILSSLNQYSTPEGMAKILHKIYADLSLPVRSCFLYLSVFPEGYTIRKNRLIQLWGAEGFISEERLWEKGETYLNELISRRLIQPVFKHNDYEAVGCTVHGVILDFIRSLSREENFATMASELSSGYFSVNTIRRFCVDCSDEEEAGVVASSRVHLSSMRSLTVFRDVPSYSPTEIPPSTSKNPPPPSDPLNLVPNFRLTRVLDLLPDFKLVRVLDLEDTHNLENQHLIGIGGLVLLRYLGIGGTGIDQLPEEIGKLMHLETLYLRLNRLPASIVNLENLMYLHLDMFLSGKETNQGLQELDKVTNLLRCGNRLRGLGLTLDARKMIRTVPRSVELFLEEVYRSKLQYLYLHFYFSHADLLQLFVDSWKEVTKPLAARFEPRKFELSISDINFKVPPETAPLLHLTHLRVKLSYVDDEVLGILGGLPKLVLLHLSSDHLGDCIVKEDVFPSLKAAFFTVLMGLVFQKRAMPQLQMLSFHTGQGLFCAGIEQLICLTRVRAVINWDGATVSEVETLETRIREQVSRNPNKPALEFMTAYEETMMYE